MNKKEKKPFFSLSIFKEKKVIHFSSEELDLNYTNFITL